MYEKDSLIGRKEFKINHVKNTETKHLENEAPKLIDKDYALLEVEEIENYQQILNLNAYISSNFPADLLQYEDYYKTVLTFHVDVDGKFKKVKYHGSNEEFNLISALYLFSVGGLEQPLKSKNTPLMSVFSLPISLVLE